MSIKQQLQSLAGNLVDIQTFHNILEQGTNGPTGSGLNLQVLINRLHLHFGPELINPNVIKKLESAIKVRNEALDKIEFLETEKDINDLFPAGLIAKRKQENA